ncbi:hypothetical protein [Streptomyces acidicola]|uniref:hypothetical protein n=1 Tax=Streptomyces acidicola TaxID=2596892 RepID=UPI003823EF50
MPASAGPEPRLDSVEIKVTFSGADAAAATLALAPDHGGARRHVYFCEALSRSPYGHLPYGGVPYGRVPDGRVPSEGEASASSPYTGETLARSRATPGQLPLLDAGVTLRLRAWSGRGVGGDVTAELRPCRRSRLSERWLDFRAQGPDSFRLAADWTGERRALAACFASDCGRTAVEAVTSGSKPLATAFSDRQRAFLAECADAPVGFGDLDILGPVHTVDWTGVRLNHHEVTLEYWTLPGDEADTPLEWFEVSERVAPEGAEVVQASLMALLHGRGLEPDLSQGTRTRRVLETLAARDAARRYGGGRAR